MGVMMTFLFPCIAVKMDQFAKNSQRTQHCSDSIIRGTSFTPRNTSTLSFPTFQCHHVLWYIWNVAFSPVQGGGRSRGVGKSAVKVSI